MNYDYDCDGYESFDKLRKKDKQTAELLLAELGLDTASVDELNDLGWTHDYLCVYPTLEDYALYELTDGWYTDYNFDGDFRGAPNPMDWIDLDGFGQRLIDLGDQNVTLALPNGKVVTTSCGW